MCGETGSTRASSAISPPIFTVVTLGKDADGVLATADKGSIDITARTASVTDGVLKTPRWGSSLHENNGELTICGGYDQNGSVLGDCEFLSSETGQQSHAPSPMPNARAEHLAIPLENDLTLLVGGVGTDRKPVAALDFYTNR